MRTTRKTGKQKYIGKKREQEQGKDHTGGLWGNDTAHLKSPPPKPHPLPSSAPMHRILEL